MPSYLSAVVALAALSVHHVAANHLPDDFLPFDLNMEAEFKVAGRCKNCRDDDLIAFDMKSMPTAEKKFVNEAIVEAFNEVHDTTFVKLVHSFTDAVHDEHMHLKGVAGRCKNCRDDDRLSEDSVFDMDSVAHKHWQEAFCDKLEESSAFSGVSGCKITVTDAEEELSLPEDFIPFDLNMDAKFVAGRCKNCRDDDVLSFDMKSMPAAEKHVVNKAIVEAFNQVHDTTFVKMSQSITSKVESGSIHLKGVAGRCKNCRDDDLLSENSAYDMYLWQKAFCNKLEESSAFSGVTGCKITVSDGATAGLRGSKAAYSS